MTYPVLLVIDVQKAFEDPVWGPRNNPDAESRIADLLAGWRDVEAPVIHIRHLSDHPEGLFRGRAAEFKDEAMPEAGEPVIEKRVNSAFIGTDLEKRLRDLGCESVTIAGLTTDHCCSTTARMAENLGFDTRFVSDATATFDRTGPNGEHFDAETMHQTALTSLHDEFAQVLTTSEALRRLRA